MCPLGSSLGGMSLGGLPGLAACVQVCQLCEVRRIIVSSSVNKQTKPPVHVSRFLHSPFFLHVCCACCLADLFHPNHTALLTAMPVEILTVDSGDCEGSVQDEEAVTSCKVFHDSPSSQTSMSEDKVDECTTLLNSKCRAAVGHGCDYHEEGASSEVEFTKQPWDREIGEKICHHNKLSPSSVSEYDEPRNQERESTRLLSAINLIMMPAMKPFSQSFRNCSLWLPTLSWRPKTSFVTAAT